MRKRLAIIVISILLLATSVAGLSCLSSGKATSTATISISDRITKLELTIATQSEEIANLKTSLRILESQVKEIQ